jgi:folate-binding protein YgfZ
MDGPPFSTVRDAVRLSGPDALTYLQSQASQDLLGVAVGDTCWTFLLEPTGKVAVLARVGREAEEEWLLDTDAGFGDVLEARLRRFMIRVRAELTAVPAASRGVEDEVARIQAGWPAMGAEIVPGETIPSELPHVVARAVSFTKGCYPGQELVERMDSRGSTAPRLLRRAKLTAPVAAGSPLSSEGREVGRITSVAGTAALALVGRAVSMPADAVVVSGEDEVPVHLTAIE